MTGVYRVVAGGMGGFLCPPGHPNLSYEVRGAPTARKLMSNPDDIMSVDSAAESEHLPAEVLRQVRELLANAKLVRSERWERNVYGYFRNSYSPDGVTRQVERLAPLGPPERHAGFLMVKRYFPDAEPRLDLIADAQGGYGQKPCLKCEKSLQYEAKVDAFAEAITCRLVCPKGGQHEVEPLR